jgi:hypothetical protein
MLLKKGFAPLQNAKEISSKPTSSPAMTNMVDLHLLPRIDPQNDTRRTSSPGGCCCFQRLVHHLRFARTKHGNCNRRPKRLFRRS